MPIKIPDDKRLTPKDLESFFSQYSNTGGPLESVLGAAVARSQNAQLPSAPSIPDPSLPATEIPKSIHNSGFGLIPMPIGESWLNMSPANSLARSRMQQDQQDQLLREKELGQVRRLILTNPELTGQDPQAWDLKGIQAYLKQVKSAKTENPLKKQKDQLAVQTAQEKLNALKKKNQGGGASWKTEASTGTVAGITPTAPVASPQDTAAMNWAKANPNDPRANGILLKLKQKGL